MHDRERRDARREALARVGRGALTLASWSARLALTVFLVGYSLVFALGILVASVALAFVAEDDAPISGAGLLLWGLLEVVMEGLFWSTHPRSRATARRARCGTSTRVRTCTSASTGCSSARHNRRRIGWRCGGSRRRRSAARGSSRSQRHRARDRAATGAGRRPAHRAVGRLRRQRRGHAAGRHRPRVPGAAPTAATQAEASAPPAWSFVRALPQFVGNPPGSTAGIVAAWSFVTAMAGVGVALDLP
ncbi:MAG: hypothetical protein U0168_18260 [Nannocystaceae bacterium]